MISCRNETSSPALHHHLPIQPWLLHDNHLTEQYNNFFVLSLQTDMKRLLFILTAIIFALTSCEEEVTVRTEGTDTIDNTTYTGSTYFVYGFLFSTGKLVSTENNPGPDITVYVNKDNTPYRLTLQADNLKPSFYKVGEYADESSAKAAFDNLKTVSVTNWIDMADPIADNQVWIYRSGDEKYTKLRIVSTKNEMQQLIAYGECTFQWVHQPDGSLTFP